MYICMYMYVCMYVCHPGFIVLKYYSSFYIHDNRFVHFYNNKTCNPGHLILYIIVKIYWGITQKQMILKKYTIFKILGIRTVAVFENSLVVVSTIEHRIYMQASILPLGLSNDLKALNNS